MSALRLGRLPDGTRDIRILEPAVGRISFTRYGLRASGSYVVSGSHATGVSHYSARKPRPGSHSPKYRPGVSDFGDDSARKNPDNGAVKAATTEVRR